MEGKWKENTETHIVARLSSLSTESRGKTAVERQEAAHAPVTRGFFDQAPMYVGHTTPMRANPMLQTDL